MPIVSLNANDPGNPNPNPAPCDPGDQVITWRLVPGAASFANPPIFFPNPPPAGYNAWPGGPVHVSGNTATAQVNKPLGVGKQETYKYSVVLQNGTTFDPEVENTGSGMGEGHGKKP